MNVEYFKEKINEGLSIRQISNDCGKSYTSIRYWLDKFNLNTEVKYKNKSCCLNCEKEVTKRNNKFCNSICNNDYKQKLIFERIENGDNTFYCKTYKRYLIFKYGEKCMECGWNKVNTSTGKVPIQLEHIDGNSDNNSLDNLKLLCPNCHSLTPTYGALNKGNGRKNRKR